MAAHPVTHGIERESRPNAVTPPLAIAEVEETDQDHDDRFQENVYLIGRPPIKDLLRFVKDHAVSGPSEAELTEVWRGACDVVQRLEKDEAGRADDPSIVPLGPEYEPLLIEFLKDPLVQDGFNTVPSEVAMVELDRLVVYQKHIDVTHAQRLARQLGSAPSDEQIFRTCLPTNS